MNIIVINRKIYILGEPAISAKICSEALSDGFTYICTIYAGVQLYTFHSNKTVDESAGVNRTTRIHGTLFCEQSPLFPERRTARCIPSAAWI